MNRFGECEPMPRREFLMGLCGGAIALSVFAGVAGCGGGGGSASPSTNTNSNNNTNNTNNTPDSPITKDISGVTVVGTSVTGVLVNAPIPTGVGKPVTSASNTVQGTKGGKVTIQVEAPSNVDALYINVGGRTGYYKLDLTGSRQASDSHHSREVTVKYNLEVNIPTGASDSLAAGIAAVIGGVLSLLFGLTICFGPCTPPPPPPDVTGRWTLTLIGPGVPVQAIPFRFGNFTRQPDATAKFNIIDESGGGSGVVVGAGSIASNGRCSIYFQNPLDGQACNGFATGGVYVKSGDDNGSSPEIKGGVGTADLCASYAGGATPADFATPLEGVTAIWKRTT